MAAPDEEPDGHGRSLVGRAARLVREYLPSLTLLVALIGVWEAWTRVFNTKPYVLPSPLRVWEGFLNTRGVLPEHVQTTLTEAIAGLLVACVVAVLLAAAITSVSLIRRVLMPILVVSQTIPMVVLAPILIIWFGFGLTPKIVVVALVGFFPIAVSTVDAIDNADPDLVGLIRSMGARRLDELRYVRLPSALPGFFAGLKIAAAYSMLAAIFGEWAGASSGLGIYILRSQASYRIEQVFVAVVITALASIGLFLAVHLIERLATPWKYASEGRE